MGETVLEARERVDSRLLVTIAIAIAVHAMVVLGVRLPPEPGVPPRFSAIEVMLVPTPEPPLASLPATQVEDIHAAPAPLAEAQHVPPAPAVTRATQARPPVAHHADELTRAPRAAPTHEEVPSATPTVSSPAALPTATQLIARSLAIASTGAGLISDKTVSGQSQAERSVYVRRTTKDFALAAYYDAWVHKVESFGNLLQRQVPPGDLRLDVALNADGTLLSVKVEKSSGVEATDDEARRVIEQAAPFASFPPDLVKKFDVMHMDVSWHFDGDTGFSALK